MITDTATHQTAPAASESLPDSRSAEWSQLRQFEGPPGDFWRAFLSAAAGMSKATEAVLLRKTGLSETGWVQMVHWAADRTATVHRRFPAQAAALAERCLTGGDQFEAADGSVPGKPGPVMVAVRLGLPQAQEICVCVVLLAQARDGQAQEILGRLQLVADTPLLCQRNASLRQARSDVERTGAVLDLMVQFNAERRFLSSALSLCNGLATQLGAHRVSLGWMDRGLIQVRAISRTERFDRRMAAVQALELAMEEAVDQDEEIVWPAPEGVCWITRDHEAFAQSQQAKFVCSVPLRLEGKSPGVLFCERETAPFGESDLRLIRIIADQAVRRLDELRKADRWFGARWASRWHDQLSPRLGIEHTGKKLLVLIVSLGFLVLCLLHPTYRTEANFILQSDQVAYLTAPFDGFIGEVGARSGDEVRAGQNLLSLHREELELEEASAEADWARYTRETEKARAAGALADMRIAQAAADQAKAHLDLTRYRLKQATLAAPFDGVIVEGEPRERIGAPIKQGEVVLKVAQTDTLYVEAEVNESDIHEIQPDRRGTIAFASQPRLKYPVRVERIQPAAVAKDGRNVFLIRCATEGRPEAWWRPGMTGICKIEAGRRSLLWIISHRTIDHLRLWLWW